MLVVVNPQASSVSSRLRNLIIYALQSRFEAVGEVTEEAGHATAIAAEAVASGDYDVITTLGGDGTLNEVVNGMMQGDGPGDTALAVLPGGAANVLARTIGMPSDLVDATEHLLKLGDNFAPGPVDLGIAGGRYYAFAAGGGLDAAAANRVDSHPRLKAQGGRWFYTGTAVYSFYRDYLVNPVRMKATGAGRSAEGVTVIAQNSAPFTYFADRPIHVCEDIGLDDGSFALAVLRRASQLDLPAILARAFQGGALARHGQVAQLPALTEATIESVSYDGQGSARPFPVQVDGDYIGDFTRLELGIRPAALKLLR